MKIKRSLSLALAALMLLSTLLGVVVITPTAAAETSATKDTVTSVPHAYVKNGLVALYSGTQNTRAGHDTASTVWEDLVSGYDVPITTDENNYFTAEGLQFKAQQNYFPQEIVDLINGDTFTVEIRMSDLVPTAPAYCTIMNSQNDYFALFRRISDDTLEFKFAANAAEGRNKVPGALEFMQDTLITVTYEAGGESRIYINGELQSEMPAHSNMGADNLFFGHAEGNRHFEALYQSIRFYNRVLTAEEIKHNNAVDGYAAVRDLYAPDGLVSLYSGIAHGEAENIWEDLIGENDVTIPVTEHSYFDGEGWRITGLDSSRAYFPQSIVDLINGEAFTVEIQFGDFISLGDSFNTFLNSQNDYFALFRRVSTDQIEFKFAKNSGQERPKVDNGLELLNNCTVTITYTVGGKTVIYVNGEACADMPSPNTMGADDLFIGHNDAAKRFDTTYKSIRFYNRELSADEIAANARADGSGMTYTPGTDGPTVEMPANVTVAQPQTNIIGDISMVRRVNDQAELNTVANSQKKPAVAMYKINSKLEVLDDNGSAFSTVEKVLVATDFRVLSAFYVENAAAAESLATFLKAAKFYDCFVVSEDPAIVKSFRNTLPTVSGVIDFSAKYQDATPLSEEECLKIRRTIKENNGTIAILPLSVAETDSIQYLYARQVNVWALTTDTPSATEQYKALLSGAIGVISDDTDGLLDIACIQLPENTMARICTNVGHRGIPAKAPENTLEGSIRAFELGANVVELDVYITTDGEVVVMHDGNTGRTCNKDLVVEASTLAQLRELYVNKGYENSAEFSQCRIPTLKEYLEYFKGKDCMLFIEIKSGNSAIVSACKKLVDEYDMYSQCTVITFVESIMGAMRKDWPEMHVGALCGGFMAGANPEAELRAVMSFIGKYNATLNPSSGGFEANDIRASLQRGISIFPWTFRGDVNVYKNHFLWGYSGLTGDNADVLGRYPKDIDFRPLEKTEYAIGDKLTGLTCDVTDFLRETEAKQKLQLIIIEGADIVKITDNDLEFTGYGTVSFVLGYKNVRNLQYTIFTQPITVTVPGEEETTVVGSEETTPEPTDDTTAEPGNETTAAVETDENGLPVTGSDSDNEQETLSNDKTGKGCASAVLTLSALVLLAGAVLVIKKKD